MGVTRTPSALAFHLASHYASLTQQLRLFVLQLQGVVMAQEQESPSNQSLLVKVIQELNTQFL